jgi:EmrB/QacA subfamily drug resistance transporter
VTDDDLSRTAAEDEGPPRAGASEGDPPRAGASEGDPPCADAHEADALDEACAEEIRRDEAILTRADAALPGAIMAGEAAIAERIAMDTGAPDTGHPRKWWIMAAVSLGMFMALLDVTIVNIAIPAIINDLHASVARVSWVINAYSLTLAVLFLSMGRVGDKFGQKKVFLFGLVIFSISSLACGLAPNIEWLVVFRVGQGVGGAAMTPISLAILLAAFPRERHGMAVGLWGAMGSVAAAVGPTLGGLIIELLSWHWIFFVNVPIGIAAFALAFAVIPERKPGAHVQGVDVPGILSSAVGLFCLVLGLIQGNEWGWTSARILGLFAVAVASYPLFMWWELRTPSPMFDFRLMRIRSFTAANTAMFFIGAAMGGAIFLLIIFLVNVLGYSELHAALAVTPMPVTALIVAPNVGRLVDRIGPRVPAVIGCIFFFIGLTLLAQLTGESTLWDATWRVIFVGAGIGFSMPTMSAAAMGSLPPQVTGVGSGALNTLRQVGFSLGLAIVVAIFSHTIADNVKNGAIEATKYVQQQTSIPAQAKQQIVAGLAKAARGAGSGGARGGGSVSAATANLPSPPAGTPAAAQAAQLKDDISAIFKNNVAKSFTWPFYAAALAALLAIGPSLFVGRRLGEHLGHEEMTRSERAEASAAEED